MNRSARRRLGSRNERDAAFQLLIACATESGGPDADVAMRLLGRTSSEVVLTLADYHGASGLAFERLRQLGSVSPLLIAQLHRRYAMNVQRHMRVMWWLVQLQTALAATGCRWAVVKGPVVVETLYGRLAGRRPYLDIDLLVDPVAFAEVLVVLDALGADLLDRNWTVIRRGMRGQVHLSLPGGLPLDLHWNLVNLNRGRMRVETGEALSRARQLDLGGLSIPSLDPADGIVHLALHAALSGGDRLLWLKDIERAAAIWRPDWESVVDRATRWNVAAPVGLLLARSRDVLGAEVPAEIPARLLGRGMATVARWVNRLSPWEYGMGRLAAPIRLLSRGIGHGLVGGTAWIAWRSIRNLDPWQLQRSSAFTPGGDERDKQAFVQDVVATARRSR